MTATTSEASGTRPPERRSPHWPDPTPVGRKRVPDEEGKPHNRWTTHPTQASRTRLERICCTNIYPIIVTKNWMRGTAGREEGRPHHQSTGTDCIGAVWL